VIVDAHAHAFLPATAFARAVDALAPAERAAPVADFLAVMAANGVEPGGARPARRGGRLRRAGAARASGPVRGGGGDARAADRGPARGAARCVRVPRLAHAVVGDARRPLAESPLLPVMRHLAAEGLPLWSYLTPDQRPLLEQLPEVVPELTVVLNHLGFFPHEMRVDAHGRPAFDDPLPAAHVETVLALARHPRVHVMLSGQYRASPPRTRPTAISTA